MTSRHIINDRVREDAEVLSGARGPRDKHAIRWGDVRELANNLAEFLAQRSFIQAAGGVVPDEVNDLVDTLQDQITAANQAVLVAQNRADDAFTRHDVALALATGSVGALRDAYNITVDSVQLLISSQDDLANAFVLRQRAGDAVGSLEAVAYNDPVGGPLTTFKIDYDFINLVGRVQAQDLLITEFTGNIIKNGNFAFGDLRGWTMVRSEHQILTRALSPSVPAIANAPLPYMLRLQGATGRFSVIEHEDDTPLKDDGELSVSCDYVAVSPGTTTFRLRVGFYDKNDVFLAWNDPPITTSSSTAWQTSERDVPIPAGTAKIRIEVGRYAIDTGPDVLVSELNVTKKRGAATLITPESVTTDLINTTDFNAAGFAVFGEGLQSANFATDDPVSPTTITGIKFTPDGPHYIGGGVFIDGETILLGTLKRRLFAAGELQTLLPTPFDARVLRQSVANFQFDHPGFIEIILIGAGGSGAALHAGSRAYATGGGAGAVVRAFLEISDTSGVYNVSLGLGGAGRSAPRGTTLNGRKGGNSFFTGPGLNLSAHGGHGGRFALGPLTQTVFGGTGGPASGGFENWWGGRGGHIGPVSAANSALATGGGSINAGLIEGAPNAIDILTVQSTSRNVIEESPGGFPLTQFLREMKLAPFGPMYYDDTNWTGAPGRYLRDGATKSVPGFGRPYGSGSGGVAIHDGSSNVAIADSRAGGNAICFIYYHTGRPL